MKKKLITGILVLAMMSGLAACAVAPAPAAAPAAAPAGEAAAQESAAAPAEEAAAPAEASSIDPESPVTIHFGSNDPLLQDVYQEIFDDYHELHPNITVEINVMPNASSELYSALSAKFASNDAPDIFTYWWDSNINTFARNGFVLDITDTGIRDKITEIKKPYNVYDGKDYAYPISYSMWGLIMNTQICEDAGITETPTLFTEFMEDMQKIRDNGLEYPFIIPAKDGSGATGPVFCYLHQIVSGQNPDYYYEVLKGEKKWNGPEWKGLLDVYGQMMEYAPPDSLGLDPDNAKTRFARGEGAFIVQSPSVVVELEGMNPDLVGKLKYIPFPLYENEEDYKIGRAHV